MMTLIETISAAIMSADGVVKEDLPEATCDDYELRARSVIDALREYDPTYRMVYYGLSEITKKNAKEGCDMPHVWKAMFIAAEHEAHDAELA